MNNLGKKVRKVIIILLALILYSIPIICIKFVSDDEIAEYKTNIKYDFKEKAYGSLVTPCRENIEEYYTISGEITSDKIHKINLPQETQEKITISIKEGEEVHCGDVIGKVGTNSIYASCNGIVKEICIGEESFVEVNAFYNLILKAYVDKSALRHFKDVMYDEQGNKYKLVSKSNQCTDMGIEVKFAMSKTDYNYGEKVEELNLYTGQTYSDILMINSNCVYQKPGGDQYYVRICDSNGVFKEECEVEVGFEYRDLISIVGIEENVYCDSGYKFVINNEEISSNSIQTFNSEDDIN